MNSNLSHFNSDLTLRSNVSYDKTYSENYEYSAKQSMSQKLAVFMRKFSVWFQFDGGYLFVAWICLQIILFFYNFWYFGYSGTFSQLFSIVGFSLPVARGAALALTVDMSIILFTVSLRFLTILSEWPLIRALLQIDRHKRAHKIMGITIVFFSIIHVIAHIFNDYRLSIALDISFATIWFTLPTTITGNIALACVVVMAITAITAIRKRNFDTFIAIHQLYLLLYAVLLFHGAFCFIKADTEPKCRSGPLFWKFALPSLIIFTTDKILALVRMWKPVKILTILEKPNEVIEIKFEKKELIKNGKYTYKSGQYLFLTVPGINFFQKHPFTICTAPEDPYLSVNIYCKGDWTTELKEYLYKASLAGKISQKFVGQQLSIESHLPHIHMEGPYLAPADEALRYETLLLVGGGIGVTPFASIMKSFIHRVKSNKHVRGKIYFIWISKCARNFEWFYDLLSEIEDTDTKNVVDISLYWTVKKVTPSFCYKVSHQNDGKDPVTKLKHAKTFYGRPRWDQVFDIIESRHRGEKVGVFYCGPKALAVILDKICKNRTSLTKFEYHKEIF